MRKAKSGNRVNVFKALSALFVAAALALLSAPAGLGIASAKTPAAPVEAVENGKTTVSTLASVQVTYHYWRKDQTYTDWNVWQWKVGADGAQVDFTTEKPVTGKPNNVWKVATSTLTSVAESGDAIGFIVRQGNWSAKDPGIDMIIKGDKITDGKVSVYVVSGDETIYYNEADSISAMGNKISEAAFADESTVHIVTSERITNKSYFKLKDAEGHVVGELDCTAATPSTAAAAAIGYANCDIKLSGGAKLDYTETYTVYDEPAVRDDEVNFAPKKVSKGKLFKTAEFNNKFTYTGKLGAEYTSSRTTFRVWSPLASSMSIKLYSAGTGGEPLSINEMTLGEKGVWEVAVDGDLNGKYYTIAANVEGNNVETIDPYAVSAGKNGDRGMILDLASTNPEGWSTQSNPTLASYSDAVIYEAQLRDLTIHESSGVSAPNRGKFLGLTETGTKNANGSSTALDYLKKLGVTEVHFQPLFDFASVDEGFTTATYNKDGEYNWGYDPKNYNVPEGSYSSDPSDGAKRVKEMKQMVMALHNAGIQVVMDVVYNHVSSEASSPFNKLVPGYYFRYQNNGTPFNGSGCGNETASENAMFRKFMIDSTLYWTKEYKIDGFRFDLMGLHDITTMNAIYDALSASDVNPDVIIYGEGWTGGDSGLMDSQSALQKNANKMPNIAVFDDIVRDELKGSVFTTSDKGFVSGKLNDPAIYVGAVGATDNSKAGYSLVNKTAFAANPTQNINYVSAHDNSTLWDKLNASVKEDRDVLKSMNRMAATAVLTGQGPSFFLAGEEMLRSKPTQKGNKYDNRPTPYLTDKNYYFSDNSYKSPDSVNAIDWNLIDTNADMVEFYTQLIAIKKTFPQFRLTTKAQIDDNVIITDTALKDGVAMYAVKDPSSNEYAVVIFNNKANAVKVSVPNGSYKVYVDGDKANATEELSSFSGSSYTVGARSAVVMKGELKADDVKNWSATATDVSGNDSNLGLALGLGIGIPAAVLIAGGVVFGVLYSKKKKAKGGPDNKGGDDGKGGDGNANPDENGESEATTEAEADAKSDDAPQDAAPETDETVTGGEEPKTPPTEESEDPEKSDGDKAE